MTYGRVYRQVSDQLTSPVLVSASSRESKGVLSEISEENEEEDIRIFAGVRARRNRGGREKILYVVCDMKNVLDIQH